MKVYYNGIWMQDGIHCIKPVKTNSDRPTHKGNSLRQYSHITVSLSVNTVKSFDI